MDLRLNELGWNVPRNEEGTESSDDKDATSEDHSLGVVAEMTIGRHDLTL